MQIAIRLTSPTWQTREVTEGTLHWRGAPGSVELLIEALARTIGEGDDSVLNQVSGHWCAILQTPTGTVAAQDPIRSWPLFRAQSSPTTIAFTDNIEEARALADNPPRDEHAAMEFRHFGFVTGSETLFSGIHQLQAGEWFAVSPEGSQKNGVRLLPRHDAPGLIQEDGLNATFSRALASAFDRLFSRVRDRQIVIPLSGGLDSRLLAIEMRDRGHTNVVNFTYGVGRTPEVNISEEVAKQLGQRWEFVSYTQKQIREAWASPAAAAFIRESYAGASLPHIQDWYPVSQLKALDLIDPDAVFLPGHTIVGNMHDEHILGAAGKMSPAALTDVLLDHHASLQPTHSELLRSGQFLGKLNEFFDRINYDGSPSSRLDALEHWNVVERQTKYINNSMRGYEHFGYEWALPMLDREVLDVWGTFDMKIAQDREWYRRYVNSRYAKSTGSAVSTFATFAAANVSKTNRDKAKATLRAMGLLRRVERGLTARAYAQHPMGFQEFTGRASPSEIRSFIMRGGQPMGIHAEEFLNDTWNTHTEIFS